MNFKTTFILISILCFIISCTMTPSRKDIKNELLGKTIVFPENLSTYSIDSNSHICSMSAFKLLVYTDSAGCTGCKLNLEAWKYYISEYDSIFHGKLDYFFYFQPKDEEELHYLLKAEEFNRTVFIDKTFELNKINAFPQDNESQCFLLDEDNKILSIGNPIINPNLWEQYKEIICKDEKQADIKTTEIEINPKQVELKQIAKSSIKQAKFTITNKGNNPLVISHIHSSCGCTVPKWDKKPVLPNENTEILVDVTIDNTGHFTKSITIFCNTKEGKHRLTISGMIS